MEITLAGKLTKGNSKLIEKDKLIIGETGLSLTCPEELFKKYEPWGEFFSYTILMNNTDPLFKDITDESQIFSVVVTLDCGCKKSFNKDEIKECRCKHGYYFIKTKLTKETADGIPEKYRVGNPNVGQLIKMVNGRITMLIGGIDIMSWLSDLEDRLNKLQKED